MKSIANLRGIISILAVVALAQVPGLAQPLAFPIAEAPFPAQVAGIDGQWNISLKSAGKIRVLRADDLAYWGAYRDVEAGPQLILTDGSVVRSDLLLLNDKQLVIGDATGLGRGLWDESMLPRSALRAIVWQPPAAAAERDRLLATLVRENGNSDRLTLLGGETLSGLLTAAPPAGRFAPEEIKPGSEFFEFARPGQAEPLRIPSARVVAIRLAQPVQPAAVSGMSAWLGLADGSFVKVRKITVQGDVVTLALAAGGQLTTTLTGRKDASRKFWDEITCLEPAAAGLAWLSDLPGLGYRHIPFLSVQRPLGLDSCVLGSRLRAGGAVHRKGLGMPTASRIAVRAAGYRRFEAQIALDEAAGTEGSAIFKVLLETAPGEWRTAFESPPVRGGDRPRQVAVELAGASRIALVVDFAERGDVCDWADWLEARLVK